MIRELPVLLMVLLLAGCTFGPGKTRTETIYQEVKVPVSNVPMPPDTSCPPLRIEVLNAEKAEDDGEIAKAYRIAIEQARDCYQLREAVINKYREIAAEDQRKIDDLERQAMASSPVGSAGPTANTADQNITTAPPIVEMDREEVTRKQQREEEFSELGSEFEKLSNKDYDIE